MKSQALKQKWRKYGALFILPSLILSSCFLPVGVGVCCLLMLTVPCGVKAINTTWWMWMLRQMYFLIMGFASLHQNLNS